MTESLAVRNLGVIPGMHNDQPGAYWEFELLYLMENREESGTEPVTRFCTYMEDYDFVRETRTGCVQDHGSLGIWRRD